MDGDVTEGAGAFADLPELLEGAAPHDRGAGVVHDEGEVGLAPASGGEHGDDEPGVGGALGGGGLVERTALRAGGRTVALEGAQ